MGPEAFDYALPREQIAQHPAAQRAAARMLVLSEHAEHRRVSQLPDMLPPRALVVLNASRVVPARVEAERADGRTFELLLTAPGPDQTEGSRVSAWVRGAKHLRAGDVVAVGTQLRLRYVEPDDVDPRARWFVVEAGVVLGALHAAGALPLPPYIERPAGPTATDLQRYQTLFARDEGSVAAPTAGLHLDADVLAALDTVSVTLHVGPGTFLPMEAADVRAHRVGRERYTIDADAAQRIQAAREDGRPIVAVGTTVARTLETAALDGRAVAAGAGATELVITPGFPFAVVTHLLTNFHLPRSSLLMLVCAFGGRARVLAAYAEAVAAGYRFYSYGDCMLASRSPA